MISLQDQLGPLVPAGFLEPILMLMSDAEAGASPGELAYFPCHDREALDHGNRLFWAQPGALPALPYELEVRIPPGTMRVRGTWLGADPLGGIAIAEPRLWVVDSHAFEVVRVTRGPEPGSVGAEEG